MKHVGQVRTGAGMCVLLDNTGKSPRPISSLHDPGIREHGLLLQTLLVYFRENLRIVEVAAPTLGIHRNILRYRVGMAESVLGVSLADPAANTNQYLALNDELKTQCLGT